MVQQASGDWDEVTDVVVVGSGGAAMVAALLALQGGSSVTVLEKDTTIGGTTAASGGAVWVPNNRHLAPAGLKDSREDAIAYITHIADGRALDPSLIEVFVDTAPVMLDHLETHTRLETQPVSNLHDYYGAIIDQVPGCKDFSRTVEPLPFPAQELLGPWADRIAARSTLLSLGADTTLKEDEAARGRGGEPADLDELARRERAGVRVKGAALIGALLHAVLEHGGKVECSTPAQELVVDRRGAVVGVVVHDAGGARRIGARQGVVLACGGFEWNREMVLAYIGYEVQPLSPGSNTGDGHLMAMELRAQMGNMGSYWGQGASFDPEITRDDGQPMPQMLRGLGAGSVIVNRRGERFADGALTYNDFPKVFGNVDPGGPTRPNRPPAWIVFGPEVRSRGPILTVRPDDPTPDWMHECDSVEALAKVIEVDAAGLEATVAAHDRDAQAAGSPAIGGPPYYAIQQWPASLGTNGGCRIDADGRVLGATGEPIPGLYAAGNTSAAVLGGAYPGGGTPIACGMTFGYLAGNHVARRERLDLGEIG